MSNIINFPTNARDAYVQIEKLIDKALYKVNPEYKDKIKQEVLKTVNDYNQQFSNTNINLPENTTEKQALKIQQAFEDLHKQKFIMLADIINLKTRLLINSYEQNNSI